MSRSLRRRVARRMRYARRQIPVISPYVDRLRRAAFADMCCYYVVVPQ